MKPIQFDLQKSAAALALSLSKAGIHTPPPAEVAFNLDVSGSFKDEHLDGLTQALLTRLTPWGVVFDPDHQLDVFTFSNGSSYAHRVGTLNEDNYSDYIVKNVIGKVPGWCGGTDYSYVLEKNFKHFGGGKRSIVLHVTDGDCNQDDKVRTREALRQAEARGDKVYVLFIGVSNQGGTFPFLKGLGDEFNNTGLVVINNLESFVHQSDDQLNEALIGSELIQWLKA